MTREERRLKREQETRKAIAVLAGLFCVIAVVVIGAAWLVSSFIRNNEPLAENNTEVVGTEAEPESEVAEPEVVEPVVDPLTEQAISMVSGLTLEQKVAQMFVITPDALAGVNGATVVGDTTKQAYAEHPVGGLIYESDNFKTREQVQEMLSAMGALSQETTGLPIFLGVSEEGGSASVIASKSPIDVDNIDDMSKVGEAAEPTAAYDAGVTIGGYLRDLGFNIDFAPVADVLINEGNAILANRSFGNDSEIVKGMVRGMLDGLAENHIEGVVKYFPGYGSTDGDGTNGAVSTDRTLEELKASELVPFQLAVDTGVNFILVGHISVPGITGNTVPSSLSDYMITQVLRTDMGFDGVVITDAMNKKAITDSYDSAQAAVTAITAGADIILMPENFEEAYNAVLSAVQNGTLTEERINTSLVRIIKAKLEMTQ